MAGIRTTEEGPTVKCFWGKFVFGGGSIRFGCNTDGHSQVSAVGDLEGWSQHDVLDRLGDVQCPMLVIRGDDDFWVPRELADEAAAALPNGEMVHLPNIGHYPMFEDPALVADLITDFCVKHSIVNAPGHVSAA